MEQEIEFKVRYDFIIADSEMRYVFWRPKPKNWFAKIFTPWRQLKKAYNQLDGYTEFFFPNDFRELKKNVKTRTDLEKWKDEQYLKAHRNDIANRKAWEDALK